MHCQHTPLLPHSHYARSQTVPSLALLDEEANVPRKLSIRVVRDVEGQAPFSSVLRDRLRGMAARGPAYGLSEFHLGVGRWAVRQRTPGQLSLLIRTALKQTRSVAGDEPYQASVGDWGAASETPMHRIDYPAHGCSLPYVPRFTLRVGISPW